MPPVLLLLFQPDLGNAVVLFGLTVLLLVVAGRPLRQLLVPAAVAAAFVAVYVASNDYARRRVDGFLDPWTEWQDAGFQLVQSFVAFGQGGLSGVGLGNGRQKLDYLFGAHTDFVLSLVAEELGLLGVLAVLGAFAALLVTGCRVALRARDRFSLLLAFAMTSLLTVPAILNGAVVMGLVPTKGLTLPFLSYGGTSLVVCCVSLGVLLGVARQTPTHKRGAREARTDWI
jgi:cell division protein FtsW